MVRRRFIALAIFSVVVLCVAQVGKHLFSPIVCNEGIGFGIGGGMWSIPLGIVFLGAAGYFMVQELQKEATSQFSYLTPLGGCFLLGGALSNLLDRIAFGCVPDYFQPFQWFPVFNIADIGVSVGVGILLIRLFCIDSFKE